MQRRNRGINYNEEVAFEKKPAVGPSFRCASDSQGIPGPQGTASCPLCTYTLMPAAASHSQRSNAPLPSVQAGFFDVRDEDATTREIGKEFRPATVDEIEGKRHRVRRACARCIDPASSLALQDCAVHICHKLCKLTEYLTVYRLSWWMRRS